MMAAWTLLPLLQGVNPPHPSGPPLTQVILPLLLQGVNPQHFKMDAPLHRWFFFFLALGINPDHPTGLPLTKALDLLRGGCHTLRPSWLLYVQNLSWLIAVMHLPLASS